MRSVGHKESKMRKVDIIAIQVAYDQTAILLSTLQSKFGPERGAEITSQHTDGR